MKQLTSAVISLRAFSTFLMILFLQTAIMAQDGGSGTSGGSGGGSGSSSSSTKSVSVTTETSTWYTEPWVWVVGAALLILLLVALLRGSGGDRVVAGRTDKVTVTKTTSTDTDI
ncbi:MAG TPA: hypothetical protein VF622_09270 [Segetibacter sp.]|jgi:hypothetical protein